MMLEVAGGVLIAGFLFSVLYGGGKLVMNGGNGTDVLIGLIMVLASLGGSGWIIFAR